MTGLGDVEASIRRLDETAPERERKQWRGALDDGLALAGVLVTAAARCAPPDNRPTPAEFARCRGYLIREIAAAPALRVIVALGGLAFDQTLRALSAAGHPIPRPRPKFAHGSETEISPFTILGAYHPSQQNTFTRRLTPAMLRAVFRRARKLASSRA